MRRLTYKNGSGKYALLIDGKEHTGEVAERLAAYEDTGLEPEEVKAIQALTETPAYEAATLIQGACEPWEEVVEIARARAQGRLIVLPEIKDENTPLAYNGRRYLPDHWNIILTAFSDDEEKHIHLFDVVSAKAALNEAQNRPPRG